MKYIQVCLVFFIFICSSVFAGIPHDLLVKQLRGTEEFRSLRRVSCAPQQVTADDMTEAIIIVNHHFSTGWGCCGTTHDDEYLMLKVINVDTGEVGLVYFLYDEERGEWVVDVNNTTIADLINLDVIEMGNLVAGQVVHGYQLVRVIMRKNISATEETPLLPPPSARGNGGGGHSAGKGGSIGFLQGLLSSPEKPGGFEY